jgi:pimeloyl-ACP methyl ester carboxylesterase
MTKFAVAGGVLGVLALAALWAGLSPHGAALSLPPQTTRAPVAGTPIAVESLGGYSRIAAKLIVWWAGFSEKVPVANGFDMYRVTYLTPGERGDLVEASGLLSLPRSVDPRTIMSWQHGTSTLRENAPSKPTPDESILISIVFAGNGALLLAPDYVGLGQSERPHPYYYVSTTVGSTRDLVVAAREILVASQVARPGDLFLAGFSQGGHATMATVRDIEQTPIPDTRLVAAASIAGPIDLDGFSLENTLKGEAENASMYLAWIFGTYARIYGEDMSAVFRAPYDATIPQLFDGKTDGREIAAHLPRDPKAMLRDDYLLRFSRGDKGWPGRRMSENDMDGWQPQTPLRLYFGANDIDVSPREATERAARWAREGANVQAVSVGALDHNGSVIAAVPLVREWFSEF